MIRRFFLPAFSSLILTLSALGGWAQRGPDIFVTPIANAPFMATVEVQRSIVQPNGTVVRLKTTRLIARDEQGRIYNEGRLLVPANSSATPPIQLIHLYDPQTRVSTTLDPQKRIFWTMTVNRPPATQPPALLYASPAGNNLPPSQYTREEDQGTHEISGLQVHGVRETQTIPADASGMGKAVMITDEYWYSDDLRINTVIKHDDPRTGSMTVTQISQEEPDPMLFQVPQGFKQAGAR